MKSLPAESVNVKTISVCIQFKVAKSCSTDKVNRSNWSHILWYSGLITIAVNFGIEQNLVTRCQSLDALRLPVEWAIIAKAALV